MKEKQLIFLFLSRGHTVTFSFLTCSIVYNMILCIHQLHYTYSTKIASKIFSNCFVIFLFCNATKNRSRLRKYTVVCMYIYTFLSFSYFSSVYRYLQYYSATSTVIHSLVIHPHISILISNIFSL